MSDSPPLIRSGALAGVPGCRHGFTTRRGGVSEGPLDSLNLAQRPGEALDRLRENWRRALVAVAGDDRVGLALVRQVHGADVVVADADGGPVDVLGDADALVTTTPGLALAVRVADCVPVLFATHGGVAAAHAGWRGTAGGVVVQALARLMEVTGAAAGDVVVAIGPHVSADAYEVGPEVVEGVLASGVPAEVFVRRGPRRDHVDLGAALEAQLRARGVTTVERTGGCTVTEDRFSSHRRDGPATGRQAGIVLLSRR
jgi:hypothetical protein